MPTTTTGVATEFINFTRASNATVTDSNGLIEWAAHNLLQYSEQFDNSNWQTNNCTVTANTSVAPNGTTTADTMTPSGGANPQVRQSYLAATSLTAGVFLKAGTQSQALLRASVSGNGYSVTFDLSAGTAGSAVIQGTGGTVSGMTGAISSVGSGWYYCRITFSDSGNSNFIIEGVATSGTILLWGAHLYRSDLGGMQANTSAYPMYNPTTPKNLLGFTENFDNAYWGRTGTSVTANSINAPNGLATADMLTGDGASSVHTIAGSASAGFQKYVSVYAKAGTNSTFQIYFGGDAAPLANFNLASGTVGTVGSNQTASITDVGGGWYRCAIFTNSATATNPVIGLTLSSSAARGEVNTLSTSIYLWGAQLSDSASLDPYVANHFTAPSAAAYYGPRRDFDPVTLACKGLLVEEQRANLLTYSSDFNNWSKVNTTVTSDQASAPDGTITADTVAATTTGTYRYVIQAPTLTTGRTYTLSTYFKTKTTQWVWLLGETSSDAIAYFDIVNGVLGTVGAGLTASILPVGNGWFRCAITFTVTSATGVQQIGFGLSDSAATSSVTAGKDVYAWGGQLEENASFATSYIPTTTASATRSADVAQVSTAAFPYSSTEGTVVVNATSALLPSAYTNGRAVALNDGTANNVIELYISQNAAVAVNAVGRVMLSGVPQSNPSKTITNSANPHKVAFAYKASDFAATGDGLAPTTETSGSVPTGITQMQLGALTTSNYLNGHIRQITYLPRRISNAELVTRST